jgi:branched-subunit amino acid permease
MKRSRNKRKCWIKFFTKAAIMLAVLFLAFGLLAVVGWEALSATGIVKEAAAALAEAAADAFGSDG